MKLHENKESFIDAVINTSRKYKIVPELIEKDYYVSVILKELKNRIPGLLFKGGTCLSKCYKIVDRFSEDIDLTLDNERFTKSKKINANKVVIQVCDDLGFKLDNREFLEKHSHGNYNCYNIEYVSCFPSYDIQPYVKVEMVFIQKAYPDLTLNFSSYIYSRLYDIHDDENIKLYELEPFDIKVQALERTLIDKVFAVCDYYLRKETTRNSRHIYDIYQILTKVDLDIDKLKPLAERVRIDRLPNKTCVSAQDGVDIPKLLQEIVDLDFYKKDYHDSTDKLLIKPVPYATAIQALNQIIDSKIFKFCI